MGRFTIELDDAINEIMRTQELVFRKIALDTLKKLQKKTPVDSGALRRSWTVGVNGSPPVYDGSQQALNHARLTDKIWLATDKPYAPMLEYGLYPNPPKNPMGKTRSGFSIQAPQGMVRITVDEMKSILARRK